MRWTRAIVVLIAGGFLYSGWAWGLTQESFDVRNPKNIEMNKKCITCHLKENKVVVQQWENSPTPRLRKGRWAATTAMRRMKATNWDICTKAPFIKAVSVSE